MRLAGIIIIVIGIIMLLTRGFSFTQKETVVDIGPIEVNKTDHKRVTWPFYAGGIAIAVGVVLIIADNKSKKA